MGGQWKSGDEGPTVETRGTVSSTYSGFPESPPYPRRPPDPRVSWNHRRTCRRLRRYNSGAKGFDSCQSIDARNRTCYMRS